MVEHVYGIIDSKIQFLDFQIKEMIKTKLGKSPQEIMIQEGYLSSLDNLTKDDKILDFLEIYSRKISLLLLMRTTLTYLSAETAFFLLTNDKYMDFTEMQLRTVLEEALCNQANQDLKSIMNRAMKKLGMPSPKIHLYSPFYNSSRR
ncbi:MAG: hypothetical protein ACJAT4_000557 [Granulosicoccus sp.]|jgi:hypothetical protein